MSFDEIPWINTLCLLTGGFFVGYGSTVMISNIKDKIKTKEPFFIISLGIINLLLGFLLGDNV